MGQRMFVLELLSTLQSSIRWAREFLGFVVVLGLDYSVGGGGRHEIQEQIDNNSLAVSVNKRGQGWTTYVYVVPTPG